jgi:hypothetical protein
VVWREDGEAYDQAVGEMSQALSGFLVRTATR